MSFAKKPLKKKRPGFSPGQQGHFRPLVEAAWQEMCRTEGLDPDNRCGPQKKCGACAFCEWYKAELMDCAGVETSNLLDVKRDFENVMYHFASIAKNLYWMTVRDGGDVRRLLHHIQQIAADRHYEQDYIEGVAVKALQMRTFPGWSALSYKQVGVVLSALKSKTRHFRDCKSPSIDPDWSVG